MIVNFCILYVNFNEIKGLQGLLEYFKSIKFILGQMLKLPLP